MKIVFALKDFYRGGGVERVQSCLARQFHNDGHQVGFFILNGDPVPESADFQVRNAHACTPLGYLRAVWQLRRWLREHAVDAIIAAKEQANLLTFLATRGLPCKVIYARHVALDVSDQWLGPRSIGWLYRLYMLGRGTVVTDSNGLRDQIARFLPRQRSRIVVCPNAVLTAQLFAAAEQASSVPVPARYLLAAGRLVPQKGFDTLLAAYSEAKRINPQLPPLLIAGDGPDLAKLRALQLTLGLSGDVHFLGYLDNYYPVVKNALLFVLSSRREGMPTVLVEALALGARVVATDCETGPRELLDDGRLGQLVPVDDIAQLARGIISSLLAEPISAASRLQVADHYSDTHSASCYLKLFS